MALSLQVEPDSHFVHFYADDDALTASVARYALEGLRAAEAVVLIAQPPHAAAVRRALAGSGVAGATGAPAGLHVLDAGTMLGRFMEGELPVPERFDDAVGDALRSASTGRTGVRAYGEMVETLWSQGNVSGALALEGLWNELARELPFSLYCAYRDTLFADRQEDAALDAACRAHTAVLADGRLTLRRSVTEHFTSDANAPGLARAFVVDTLVSGGDDALADSAALVVSELATNAVMYGGADFSVTVSSLAGGVRISLRDISPELPAQRDASPGESNGRGLRIVDALCRDWGTTTLRNGKVVWAELDRS